MLFGPDSARKNAVEAQQKKDPRGGSTRRGQRNNPPPRVTNA